MTSTFRVSLMIVAFAILVACGMWGATPGGIDVRFAAHLAEWRHTFAGLTKAVAALTQFGSALFLFPLAGLIGLALLFRRAYRAAALVVATILAERIALDGLKLLVERPRPAFDVHPVYTHSFSFPSGHAANTMTTFVAIALFALPERWRPVSVPVAAAIAALIGMTRPWLGVHWPSDVVGGWSLALLSIVLAQWISERASVRADRTPAAAA